VRTVQGSNDTLNWILSDHLGSASVTANADGTWNSEIKYTAFGEVRASYGLTPTDYRYTGQLDVAELGLIYFVARFYDPYLNRFLSPDSIIPDPHNPLDWDRFSYARNNPVNYSDPTGHWPEWVDYLAGAVYQYLDDSSLGAFSDLVVDLDSTNNIDFQLGRNIGRDISTAKAGVDTAVGAFIAGAGLAGIGPTLTGGSACALATGGTCALPAGGALIVEGGMVVGGTLVAGSGMLVMSSNRDPINGGLQTQSQINKSINSLQKRITEHQEKLNTYIEDPWKFDNEGLLKNAPNDAVRQRIISGRIAHLQGEIDTWQRQINRLQQHLIEISK